MGDNHQPFSDQRVLNTLWMHGVEHEQPQSGGSQGQENSAPSIEFRLSYRSECSTAFRYLLAGLDAAL